MSCVEQLPAQQRLFKKIGAFELNKALLQLGFGTWAALEPGKLKITIVKKGVTFS